jgi:hypothetical protein
MTSGLPAKIQLRIGWITRSLFLIHPFVMSRLNSAMMMWMPRVVTSKRFGKKIICGHPGEVWVLLLLMVRFLSSAVNRGNTRESTTQGLSVALRDKNA